MMISSHKHNTQLVGTLEMNKFWHKCIIFKLTNNSITLDVYINITVLLWIYHLYIHIAMYFILYFIL